MDDNLTKDLKTFLDDLETVVRENAKTTQECDGDYQLGHLEMIQAVRKVIGEPVSIEPLEYMDSDKEELNPAFWEQHWKEFDIFKYYKR